MVTTHDSARARAYTADLVSHGVRSRVASPPRPAPNSLLQNAECRFHTARLTRALGIRTRASWREVCTLPAPSSRWRHLFGCDAARTHARSSAPGNRGHALSGRRRRLGGVTQTQAQCGVCLPGCRAAGRPAVRGGGGGEDGGVLPGAEVVPPGSKTEAGEPRGPSEDRPQPGYQPPAAQAQ